MCQEVLAELQGLLASPHFMEVHYYSFFPCLTRWSLISPETGNEFFKKALHLKESSRVYTISCAISSVYYPQ